MDTDLFSPLTFSEIQRDKQSTHYDPFHTRGTRRCKHTVTCAVSDRPSGQAEARLSWPPSHCSFTTTMLSIPQSTVKVPAAEGTGEGTLSPSDGTLETETELREPEGTPSIKFTHTHTFWSLFLISAHTPLSFLFLETYLEMKPFKTAHPQTVCDSVIDNASAAKKWKCCFNNLGLKYILLYASKGFNKKSTCRDIFSWLKQQSKAYKCSPTIMTYL